MTVEDALHEAEDRVAAIRYLAWCAATNPFAGAPDPNVFGGLQDILEDVERLVRCVRHSLSEVAMAVDLKPDHGERG